MLCAIDASFVFQVLTRLLVGYNSVVSGMVVGVLDSVMDSVLDPNSLWPPAEVENLNKCEFARISVEPVFAA
jgi:hypothetical protein